MILRMFGIGAAKALAGGQTEGSIKQVKTCYWPKVNTKPVRVYAGDGAVYPHVIHFTYSVGGQAYTGKRYVPWSKRCPVENEKITVYFERNAPAKYAVII